MAPKGTGIAAGIIIFLMIAIVLYFLYAGMAGPGFTAPTSMPPSVQK